ncbi:MAG: hypothetical protein ACOYOV_15185 [Bacteroidales bacterium]
MNDKLMHIPKNDVYQRIYHWVMNKDSAFISPQDKLIFDRWDFCDNLLRKYGKLRQVENMMKAKYPNISLVQIKRDIENTKRFFASIHTVNKEYEKLFLLEDIRDTMLQAKNTGNLMARAKAQQNLYMVLGLGKEDSIDLSLLEKHDYILAIAARDTVLKIDLLELQKLSYSNKKMVADFLESEITDVEAFKIMNPELPSYDSEETILE